MVSSVVLTGSENQLCQKYNRLGCMILHHTGLCKVTGYFRTPLNSYIHGVILKTIWHGKSHNWLVLFGVWQWVISGQVPLENMAWLLDRFWNNFGTLRNLPEIQCLSRRRRTVQGGPSGRQSVLHMLCICKGSMRCGRMFTWGVEASTMTFPLVTLRRRIFREIS